LGVVVESAGVDLRGLLPHIVLEGRMESLVQRGGVGQAASEDPYVVALEVGDGEVRAVVEVEIRRDDADRLLAGLQLALLDQSARAVVCVEHNLVLLAQGHNEIEVAVLVKVPGGYGAGAKAGTVGS